MSQLQCSWVPGTFNRVRMNSIHDLIEITIERAERILGRGSLHDLYLKGRVTLTVNEDVLQRLSA
ncbi:hypothetical protein [Deinococcus peraridilitoris]|uniref:Uncharacterized protein n=1 Tax=Deinococcus peraridilitoris (strain DSM 19664 / LMG 22246 / CIP 109416 / KR-200) TaxID=937777 RepID=L0A5D2_DEIPD|nr:hypothetical protein [Deinococcus peraridilitoris]AFZ68392.1 hypothetical protein Deipe_2935 [Deinococcus peraridilitoris DSM 19664]